MATLGNLVIGDAKTVHKTLTSGAVTEIETGAVGETFRVKSIHLFPTKRGEVGGNDLGPWKILNLGLDFAFARVFQSCGHSSPAFAFNVFYDFGFALLVDTQYLYVKAEELVEGGTIECTITYAKIPATGGG